MKSDTPRDLGISAEERAKIDAEIDKAEKTLPRRKVDAPSGPKRSDFYEKVQAEVEKIDREEANAEATKAFAGGPEKAPPVYQPHEAADLFPLLTGDELDDLVESIRDNGLRDPIVLYEGKILDGRNRYRACQEANVQPRFVTLSTGINPWTYSWDKNGVRRHVEAGTRAAIFVEVEEGSDRWEADHQSSARLEAAKDRPRDKGDGRFSKRCSTSGSRGAARGSKKSGHEVSASRAKVSPATLRRAMELRKRSPDLFAQVRTGKIPLKKALREAKGRDREAKRSASAALIPPQPDLGVDLREGDFREALAGLPDGSVSLIFTDPPYLRENLSLYGDLAKEASRLLCEGGSLIVYVGHYALPEVFPIMTPHLRYWWVLGVKHGGGGRQLEGVHVTVRWKPLLWFVKGSRGHDNYVVDMVDSEKTDKSAHDWQQSTVEATYYIEKLTKKGDVVVDPFAGSGTTLVAAKGLDRVAIGCEKDHGHYVNAVARLMKARE